MSQTSELTCLGDSLLAKDHGFMMTLCVRVRRGLRDRERFSVPLQYAELLLCETETQPRSLPSASPHALVSNSYTAVPSARDHILSDTPGSNPDGSLSSLYSLFCTSYPY